MSPDLIERAVPLLIGLATVQQAAEHLRTRTLFGEGGALGPDQWARDLRGQGALWSAILRPVGAPAVVTALLAVQVLLGAALTMGVRAAAAPALLVHIVMQARFRGTSNGGSDTMTATALLGVVIDVAVRSDTSAPPGLLWIGVQCLLSYVVAAAARLPHRAWWDGRALQLILTQGRYPTPRIVRSVEAAPLVRAAAPILLIFEATTTLVWIVPGAQWAFAAGALLLHIGIAAVLGLHRFLLPWAAGWAAVLALAPTMQLLVLHGAGQ